MGFAFQAVIAFAGLAFSVCVAVGLAEDRPVTKPAQSLSVAVEPFQLPPQGAESSELVAEAGVTPDGGSVEPRAPRAAPPVLRRTYRITAYNDRGTTASGRQSGVGQCAAPADIPFGSRIYIPALRRTLIVTDRTHPRFRHNTVDIFMPGQQQCLNFGRKFLRCEITLPSDASTPRARG
jgi:rare lipoprotein A